MRKLCCVCLFSHYPRIMHVRLFSALNEKLFIYVFKQPQFCTYLFNGNVCLCAGWEGLLHVSGTTLRKLDKTCMCVCVVSNRYEGFHHHLAITNGKKDTQRCSSGSPQTYKMGRMANHYRFHYHQKNIFFS